METMKKGLFSIDDIDKSFEGFTDGKLWNGWETPLFKEEVILDIFKNLKAVYDKTLKIEVKNNHIKITTDNDSSWGLYEEDKGVVTETSSYINGLHLMFDGWTWYKN